MKRAGLGGKSARQSRIIRAAVSAVAVCGFASSALRAGIQLELRATGGSGGVTLADDFGAGKHVIVSNPGDIVTFNVFARVSGTDAIHNEELQSMCGLITSGAGGILGNLTHQIANPFFTASASSNGTVQDIDGDGDLDVGSSGTTANGKIVYRSGSIVPLTPLNSSFVDPNTSEIMLGTATFSVTNLAGGGTTVQAFPRAGLNAGVALWREDGVATVKTAAVSPYTLSMPAVLLDIGAPLYWDTNGTDSGAGGPAPVGTWGTDSFWSTDAGGESISSAWNQGVAAHFSAGTDASGAYTVAVSGTRIASALAFDSGNVTLSGGGIVLTGGMVTVSSAGATIGSDIVGAAGLSKSGPGTLVLAGANTYAGNTAVTEGTLKIGATSALPSGDGKGIVLLEGTSELDLAGYATSVNGLSSSTLIAFTTGTVTNSSTSAATLTIGAGNATSTFAGEILDGAAPVAVTKVGSGTFVVTGNNNYTGGTTISAGTLQVGIGTDGSMVGDVVNHGVLAFNRGTNSSFDGAISGTGSFVKMGTSASGSTLVLTGDSSYTGGTTISSGTLQIGNGGTTGAITGNVVNAGTLAFNRAGNLTLTGTISGLGGLSKAGTGTVLLTASNSHTGTTTITGGVLSVRSIGNGGVASALGAGSNQAIRLVLNGGTLQYLPVGNTPASTDRLFTLGNAGGTISAGGIFSNSSLGFTSNLPINLDGNGSRTLILDSSNLAVSTFAPQLSNPSEGATSLTKTGTGTWSLTNASNNYAGPTTVNGGVLSVPSLANGGTASPIGASSNQQNSLVLNGGTLRYTPQTNVAATTDRLFTLGPNGGTLEALAFGSGSTLSFTSTGQIVFSGSGDRTLTLSSANTGNSTFSPSLSDPSGGKTSLVKVDTGTWVLSGAAKTYSGNTIVNTGRLRMGVSNVLPFGNGKGNVQVDFSGTLDLNGQSININGLNGAGVVTSASSSTLVVGNGGASGSFAGSISGPIALSKTGSTGTQTLTGPLTYTGSTTVQSGKLALATAMVTSPNVTVGNGATLELVAGTNSIVRTNTLTIQPGGRVDLTDNRLITSSAIGTWNGSSYTGVTGLLASGFNGGTWNGSGIITSMSLALPSNYTSLGVATASEVLGIGNSATGVWSGRVVTGSDTLVMYTYGGDVDLSGNVDIDDYGRIDASWSSGINTGYINGDLNFDGKINVDDYGFLDFVVNIQGPPLATSSATGLSIAAIPEPATICLVPALATLTWSRRKRRP